MASKQKKIVIIDDDKTICEIYTEIFNEVGYECLGFVLSTDGIEYIQNNIVDVVICDYRMPTHTGLEVLEQLNKAMEKMPLFYLMSGVELDIDPSFKKMGLVEFFKKPIELNKLVHSIDRNI